MVNHIHILGASGSGTTTLGAELSKRLGYIHLDTDDYFWEKTNPPFQSKRPVEMRQKHLKYELNKHPQWILTGSLTDWGDIFIPYFDMVIYLWVPQDTRISRLKEREYKRYGKKIDKDGEMYKTHIDFIEWASQYDSGTINMRSRKLHDKWLNNIPCKVLRLEGLLELEYKVREVIKVMN